MKELSIFVDESGYRYFIEYKYVRQFIKADWIWWRTSYTYGTVDQAREAVLILSTK